MVEAWELAALVFLAAALYSSVGHAGASGYLAAMAIVGLAPETMRPTALALNILVATIATTRYARAGQFDWRTLWPFALASVPAAFLGGMLHLPTTFYRPLVGLILLLAALELVRSARRSAAREARPPRSDVPVAPALLIGAGIGLLSGLTVLHRDGALDAPQALAQVGDGRLPVMARGRPAGRPSPQLAQPSPAHGS
jgi:uncharacterized protein